MDDIIVSDLGGVQIPPVSPPFINQDMPVNVAGDVIVEKGKDGKDGKDGFSPIAIVSQTDDGATITITDANGTTTANIYNGADGTDGAAASVSVGTTTTTAAGTNASVVNSGTSSAAILDFSIPRGESGENGEDGFSPTVQITELGGGSTIIITDKNGEHGTTIYNGTDGESATVSVGSTTTGNAGTNASVVNSGTSSTAVLDFTIPRGADGADGSDGFSPIATVSQSGGTTTISITDKNGTTTESIVIPTQTSDLTNDGSDGTSTYVETDELATVATTGAYSDLSGTPTIPAAQVNSDWNANSGVAEILNKPNLATVATTGAYSDLAGTPTIPSSFSDLTGTVSTSQIANGAITSDKLGGTSADFTASITFTVGYANASFRKFGNLVVFSYQSDRTNFAVDDVLFTLPAAYYPASVNGFGNAMVYPATFNGATPANVFINPTTGVCTIQAAASNVRVYVAGSYFVN